MLELTKALTKATANWRKTAKESRLAAEEIPDQLARGHMHGLSDGLNVAAEDVDTLITADDTPHTNGK